MVGPNGAGKRTLIRMLLADLAPDSGTVEFAGARRTPRAWTPQSHADSMALASNWRTAR
ncbi:MAG: ATP-binding cassette domain-containing protein [Bifidobacteriaceae bacterium]|nr:ATP-binding cassette domain-containing protein [Bifidobacteriaceae bacterium]